MGLIEKSIRNRGNQKLAASRFIDTKLASTEVVDAVCATCEHFNSSEIARVERLKSEGNRLQRWMNSDIDYDKMDKYHITEADAETIVTWARTWEQIQRMGKYFKATESWVARVRTLPPASGEIGSVAELTLLLWVVDGDGKVKNRKKFEELADHLHHALASAT